MGSVCSVAELKMFQNSNINAYQKKKEVEVGRLSSKKNQ